MRDETAVRKRRIWPWIAVAALVGAVVWVWVAIALDNAYKAEAQQACVEDVTAKYLDETPDVVTRWEGRDGDQLQFTAVDTLATFTWTCHVTKDDAGNLVVESYK